MVTHFILPLSGVSLSPTPAKEQTSFNRCWGQQANRAYGEMLRNHHTRMKSFG
jgi:hypothetical protein